MNKDYFLNQLKNKKFLSFNSYNYDLLPNNFYAQDYIQVKCPIHGIFKQKAYHHTQGGGCPTCSRIRGGKLNSLVSRFSLEKFITKANEIHNNFYSYEKVIYETNSTKVIITCPKHGDFIQRAGSHLAGSKCIKCYQEENKLPLQKFIDNAKIIHGDKYDYSKVIYLGNKRKIEIICHTHGSFWQKPNAHVSSRSGCRFCSESKGESAVEVFLKKYGIPYIREYRILPYLYRYDFYLPELNIFIEFHGHQHYKPVELFGGEEGFLSIQERDKYKKLLVKANNGKLIVLTYLNLTSGSLEKELIRYLKTLCAKWYLIDNKLTIFKKIDDVYKTFNISLTVLVKNLDSEVRKKVNEFKLLF